MATNYPGGYDEFIEPTLPESTPLSQAGSGNYNHVESHTNMGDAIEALQHYAALRSHNHSGDAADPAKGAQLTWSNTHQTAAAPTSLTNARTLADTDKAASAIHHTLGTEAFQAAAGNHTHDYNGGSILNVPYLICTSSTRPAASQAGLTIYETDTNRMRVWSDFGSGYRWTLMPTGSIPIVRLSQGINQQISATGTLIQWSDELEDNFGYFNSGSPTVLTVSEPGVYHIDAALQWNVNIVPERATVIACINGQDTVLRNSSFQRGGVLSLGNSASTDFSQTIGLSGKLRVGLGDTVSIRCRYSASNNILNQIFSFFDGPSKVRSRLEMHYVGP